MDDINQLLDIGYAFMDAGMVFITAIRGLTAMEAQQLKTISQPFEVLIVDLEKSSSLHVMCTTISLIIIAIVISILGSKKYSRDHKG